MVKQNTIEKLTPILSPHALGRKVFRPNTVTLALLGHVRACAFPLQGSGSHLDIDITDDLVRATGGGGFTWNRDSEILSK